MLLGSLRSSLLGAADAGTGFIDGNGSLLQAVQAAIQSGARGGQDNSPLLKRWRSVRPVTWIC